MRRAGLYIHIPFCQAKCAYCDFASFPALASLYDAYVDAVRVEAYRSAQSWAGVIFDTVYIGGGTPSVMPTEALVSLLVGCRAALALEAVEVSMEANPNTVTLEALRVLRAAGVNRLSLGIQSFDDLLLQAMGRIHDASQARAAVALARQAGFENISLDLLFGFPGQTWSSWTSTVQEALALGPEHLSLYALTVEEGTPLAEAIGSGRLPKPDDDLAADMYLWAQEELRGAGYIQYEISNWARDRIAERPWSGIPAFACLHNVRYWRNEPYLGLGSAAYSYDGVRRYGNVKDPAEYIRRIEQGVDTVAYEECLSPEGAMGETMMLGLRLLSGVEAATFYERFGISLEDAYAVEIAESVQEGLLEQDARGIRLTPRGLLLGNRVFARFLRQPHATVGAN